MNHTVLLVVAVLYSSTTDLLCYDSAEMTLQTVQGSAERDRMGHYLRLLLGSCDSLTAVLCLPLCA